MAGVLLYPTPRATVERSLLPQKLRGEADYSYGITNKLSEEFYAKASFQNIKPGPGLLRDFDTIPLMYAKYHLRFQLGICAINTDKATALFLKDDKRMNRSEFDCLAFIMKVYLCKQQSILYKGFCLILNLLIRFLFYIFSIAKNLLETIFEVSVAEAGEL